MFKKLIRCLLLYEKLSIQCGFIYSVWKLSLKIEASERAKKLKKNLKGLNAELDFCVHLYDRRCNKMNKSLVFYYTC